MTPPSSQSRVAHGDLLGSAVLAGLNAHLTSPEVGMADAFAEGLAAALNAVLCNEQALSRARRALLTAPPHGVKHDDAARLEHMRQAIIAAVTAPQDESA